MRRHFCYLTSLLLLGVLFILLGCHSNETLVNSKINENEIESVVIQGSYPYYEEEETLFNDADLVIIGHSEQTFMDREHVIDYMESYHDNLDQAIGDYYTETQITISEIIKQPSSEGFSPNDEIIIIEPISIITYDDGTIQKLISSDYQELEENDRYLLYLVENTFGEYTIINGYNGRFNLDQDEERKYSDEVETPEEETLSTEDELKIIHEKIFEAAKERIEYN